MNYTRRFIKWCAWLYVVWTLCIFGLPFLQLLQMSFRKYEMGIPSAHLSLTNYQMITNDAIFRAGLMRSLGLSAGVALLVTLIALCAVLGCSVASGRIMQKTIIFICVIVLFGGLIPRVHALEFLLSSNGIFGAVWRFCHLPGEGSLLYTELGLVVAYLPILLPFSIAILAVARSRIRQEYLDAATDLGAANLTIQWKVVVPLMRAALTASFIIVFLGVLGDVVVVDLIGGGQVYTAALQIIDYVKINNWGEAAAASTLLLGCVGIGITVAIFLVAPHRERT